MTEGPVVGPAKLSGNGCILRVEPRAEGWEIAFASEPRTSPQPLWFHLEAGDLAGAPVEFVWENPDICLGNPGELASLRPVLKSDHESWRRCDAVRLVEHEDGRKSLCFSHEGGANRVSAAFCFPYGPPHLEATLADTGDVWERCVIGVTTGGRPLPRLRLRGDHSESRAGLYLSARQHSGESPGSWVLDGILRFLADDSDEARQIGRLLDVWVCPFVDLDGVVEGNYGKDALPWDFNRAWEPMPMRSAVHAIMADLRRFRERTSSRLLVDLHGPGHSTPGVYVQLPRAERPELQMQGAQEFASDLADSFPELHAIACAHETNYASRWNKLATIASWAWDTLGETQAVSVETSYQRLVDEPLYPDDYRRIGRRVLRAAHAWLQRREEE